jgi:hypothetical protein
MPTAKYLCDISAMYLEIARQLTNPQAAENMRTTAAPHLGGQSAADPQAVEVAQ